jgi:hypothetical protein
MTDSNIIEARVVALYVLNGMRTAAVIHATEAQELQIIYLMRLHLALISK